MFVAVERSTRFIDQSSVLAQPSSPRRATDVSWYVLWFQLAGDDGKANTYKEGMTGIITMDDDDPQAVKRLLLYLYTLDYPEEDASDVLVSIDPSHPSDVPSAGTVGESDLGTMTVSSDWATPSDSRMMNNVLVYAIAEKYDISELKDLAKHKFRTQTSAAWPLDDFHAVTEAVFSTTPETDTGLRQIVMDICGEHSEDILRDKESRLMFFENKAIAAVVLDAAARDVDHYVKRLNEALAEQATMHKSYLEAQEEKVIALKQNSAWISRLDVIIKHANNLEKCRHCHREPKWLLERVEDHGEFGIQLRCSSCRTKH